MEVGTFFYFLRLILHICTKLPTSKEPFSENVKLFSVHPTITFEEHIEVGTFLVSRHFVKSASLMDRYAFLSTVISKHLNEPSKFPFIDK